MGVCPSRKSPADYVRLTLVKEPTEYTFGTWIKRDQQKRIRVQSINPGGPLDRYNEANPDKRIEVGDRVISVDGGIARNALMLWNLANRPGPTEVDLIILREPPKQQKEPEELLAPFKGEVSGVVGCTDCAICLEDLASEPLALEAPVEAPASDEDVPPPPPPHEVVILPCKHAFHKDCAKAWLESCRSIRCAKCPMCRKMAFEALLKEAP